MGSKFLLPLNLILLVSLFLECQLCFSSQQNGSFLCRSEERQSLLQLHQQFHPNHLYNWNNNMSSDCCSWKGVTCSKYTAHVIGLKLANGNLSGTIGSNSSVLRLNRLRTLVLSNIHGHSDGLIGELPANLFQQLPNLRILHLHGNPNLKGSLSSVNKSHPLQELDLSSTSVGGSLPHSIGFFSSMRYLDLSSSEFSGSIPESIGNLTELEEIDFSSNEFSGNLPSTISSLRKLINLDVSRNLLQGLIPDAFGLLQNLKVLDLHDNSFDGLIPLTLTNLSQLQTLDLSFNALTALPHSDLAGLHNVRNIDLSENQIKGIIPSWILVNLSSLWRLDLHSNFSGKIITKFQLKHLFTLSLSHNQLIIDDDLEVFSYLSELKILDISGNSVLKTKDPYNVGSLVSSNSSRLSNLRMSSCGMRDFPPAYTLRNLSSLGYLDLSNNEIHGPIPKWFNSMPWSNLVLLFLQSNYLTGSIPPSISNMTQLALLNLSNNKMSGQIPSLIGNFTSQDGYYFGQRISVLDLSRNEFTGPIPLNIAASTDLAYLRLNGNKLEGRMPPSLSNCTLLQVLDLGNNMIHDTFPQWLENLPDLKIIILKSNRFYGPISLPFFSKDSFTRLQIIDFSHNNFSGHIPEKLSTNLEALKSMDADDEAMLGHLKRSNHFPSYLYMQYFSSYVSMSLTVKGQEVEISRIFTTFTTIDLSSNNFSGRIPESIGNLSLLRLLNLSHNSISGNIPPSLGHMPNLEQLDLSWNQLTGGIPNSLTNLTSLASLNISHNHLSGRIPNGKQFSTFSNDSYIGNSGLCGSPLTRDCDPNSAVPSPS